MTNKHNLISAEQTADYLSITTRTLANWRCRGFPKIPYSKIGRCVRYRLSDLDDFIARHSHNTVEDEL